MTWWRYLDGRYLLSGVDLEELISELPADRMMNVVDAVLVDDIVYGSMLESGIDKVRTKLLSVYNNARTQSGRSNDEAVEPMHSRKTQPLSWTPQTDEGYVGLEAPLGSANDWSDGGWS